MSERSVERKKRLLQTAVAVLGAVALVACTTETHASFPDTPTATMTEIPSAGEAYGPCVPFEVYALNRWLAHSTPERAWPDVDAKQVGILAGGEAIKVDGWVHTHKAAYPNNSQQWQGFDWVHTEDGWINVADVRAVPDKVSVPTGIWDYDGISAVLDPRCEMSLKTIAKS